MVSAGLEKANKVNLSTICPRPRSADTQKKIDTVNEGLVTICESKPNATLIDSTRSFYTGDGDINDGFILRDGVHITNSAMNHLAKKWKLEMRDPAKGVCSRFQPTNLDHRAPPHRNNGRQQQGRQYSHMNNYNRHHHSTNDQSCYNCGEANHLRNRCAFSAPIRCYQCGGRGHKARNCGGSRRPSW